MSQPTLEELLPKPIPLQPWAPPGMRKGTVYRTHDETGVSGSGPVAQIVLLATGHLIVQWLCPPDPGDIQIKKSIDSFLDTHVHPHPSNRTIITWEDGHQDFYGEDEQKGEE